eukprot:GSA25T00001950001.1
MGMSFEGVDTETGLRTSAPHRDRENKSIVEQLQGGVADDQDGDDHSISLPVSDQEPVLLHSCCSFPKLYEMSLWVESSLEHEREMLKKPLPKINTKGHMCERAIRNSFDVLLHAGDEFRKLIRESQPLIAELARELTCLRCVPGYAQFLQVAAAEAASKSNEEKQDGAAVAESTNSVDKERSTKASLLSSHVASRLDFTQLKSVIPSLKMYFQLVNSMESGLLNVATQLYNPEERDVLSTNGDLVCPTYQQPVSGLFRRVDRSEFVLSPLEQTRLSLPGRNEVSIAPLAGSIFRSDGDHGQQGADPTSTQEFVVESYHLGHGSGGLSQFTEPGRFPESAQQIMEGLMIALSFPYSVVTQEVFLRNLGWECMLKGLIDEDDRMWGNWVLEKSKMYGDWIASAAASKMEALSTAAAKKQRVDEKDQDEACTRQNSRQALHHVEHDGHALGALRENLKCSSKDSHKQEVLCVLVSNRTADDVVDRLAGELLQETRPTLVLEETVGDAMQALGRECHGTAESRFCLRPMHASTLKMMLRDKQNVEVVWKRHANTHHLFGEHSFFEKTGLDTMLQASSRQTTSMSLRDVSQVLVDKIFVRQLDASDGSTASFPGYRHLVVTEEVQHYVFSQLQHRVSKLRSPTSLDIRIVDLREPRVDLIVESAAGVGGVDGVGDTQVSSSSTSSGAINRVLFGLADGVLAESGVKARAFCRSGLPLPTARRLRSLAHRKSSWCKESGYRLPSLFAVWWARRSTQRAVDALPVGLCDAPAFSVAEQQPD